MVLYFYYSSGPSINKRCHTINTTASIQEPDSLHSIPCYIPLCRDNPNNSFQCANVNANMCIIKSPIHPKPQILFIPTCVKHMRPLSRVPIAINIVNYVQHISPSQSDHQYIPQSSRYTWYAITIIHNKNTAPTSWKAHAAVQDWQILFCINHANVLSFWPVLGLALTYNWQLPLTLPLGPHNCIETTMRPTVQRTRRMKQPMMTMPGSNWRAWIR